MTMDLNKIVNYVLITLSLILAVIFYFSFDLENILWEKYDRPTISQKQIDDDRSQDYTGLKGDDDIPLITSLEEWKDVLNEIDYVRIIPKSIEKTDVYSKVNWIGYYKTDSRRRQTRKIAEVRTTSLDISRDYIPYYIIELDDGNRILAQMNRGIADKIAKGEKIELPLGKKKGFTQTAKNALSEYEVPTDYVLYTIDDSWSAQNRDRIFFEKVGISAALFLVLAVILQLVSDKIFEKH